jgi:glycerate kinase
MSGFPAIVVAPNSFKGSLSAFQAATAMERGILRAIPSANIHECSMADVGEGTLGALLSSRGHRD